jgi:hypothetical protein
MNRRIFETNSVHAIKTNTQNIISFNGDDHVEPLPQFTVRLEP